MRRRSVKSHVKFCSLPVDMRGKLIELRKSEEGRILRGEVKFVDTERNTNGEGNLLGFS